MTRRSRLLLGLVAALVVGAVAVVLLVLGTRDDDGKTGGASSEQDRLRVIILARNEDASIPGTWGHCRPQGVGQIRPGTKVVISGANGERVGESVVRNVASDDMDRLADLDRRFGGSLGLGDSTGRQLQGYLKRTEGATCLLHFSAHVDRSDTYELSFADVGSLDIVTRDELSRKGFFLEFSTGP